MDKAVEILCKQNPVMKMECGNPECDGKFQVKSKEFFKDTQYSHICEKCGKSTEYDTTEFVSDFKKQLKALGIIIH